MSEQPGLSDQYRRASPWPIFVALGLAISEIGVALGLFPVAVAGLLVFGGCIAGILTESGYTQRPWPTVYGLGALLAVIATGIVLWQVPPEAISLANFGQNGILSRGLAIATAGVIMVVVGGIADIMARTTA